MVIGCFWYVLHKLKTRGMRSVIYIALTLLLPRIEQLLLLHRALWQLRQRTEKLLSTIDLNGHCTCLYQLRLRPWALLVRGLLNSSRIWARGSHYKHAGDPLSRSYLVHHLSVAVQRGNAASILGINCPFGGLTITASFRCFCCCFFVVIVFIIISISSKKNLYIYIH